PAPSTCGCKNLFYRRRILRDGGHSALDFPASVQHGGGADLTALPALSAAQDASLGLPVAKPNLVDSPIRRRRTPTLFPAILGLHLDKRATLVKDVSVLSSSWGAMKHEASRARSHYRLSNVISGWRCRATT